MDDLGCKIPRYGRTIRSPSSTLCLGQRAGCTTRAGPMREGSESRGSDGQERLCGPSWPISPEVLDRSVPVAACRAIGHTRRGARSSAGGQCAKPRTGKAARRGRTGSSEGAGGHSCPHGVTTSSRDRLPLVCRRLRCHRSAYQGWRHTSKISRPSTTPRPDTTGSRQLLAPMPAPRADRSRAAQEQALMSVRSSRVQLTQTAATPRDRPASRS
jgi:hypothetical protein